MLRLITVPTSRAPYSIIVSHDSWHLYLDRYYKIFDAWQHFTKNNWFFHTLFLFPMAKILKYWLFCSFMHTNGPVENDRGTKNNIFSNFQKSFWFYKEKNPSKLFYEKTQVKKIFFWTKKCSKFEFSFIGQNPKIGHFLKITKVSDNWVGTVFYYWS